MNFFVNADQVVIRKSKNTGGVRSVLLEPSHLIVNLENNIIHIDFLLLLRDVNLSIISLNGKQIYQQVVSPQTSSIDIDLNKQDKGKYIICFTDETNVHLRGEFVISE